MDKFKFIELKNILYKHNITHIPFDENQIDELWEIIKSYKIEKPCIFDNDKFSWLNMTIPYHMTIRDILSMNHGDAIEIIFLNKEFMNFENVSLVSNENRNISPLVIEPMDFFLSKKYKVCKSYIYIHNEGYSGIIRMGKEWKKFDWDIEIYTDEFKSRNDMVEEIGEEAVNNFKPKLEMRVGWKGPCIAVKNLELCPDIIY